MVTDEGAHAIFATGSSSANTVGYFYDKFGAAVTSVTVATSNDTMNWDQFNWMEWRAAGRLPVVQGSHYLVPLKHGQMYSYGATPNRLLRITDEGVVVSTATMGASDLYHTYIGSNGFRA